ncbi:hypothetical protein WA026_022519 [Henosepilachna vigintioctopunctata]|uniref:Uncharacterized protein n=1 Tax=Henosepilachna vigintioctopunctata TaxID=420089 RepID=A0AAW1UIW7_9CUCU
MKYIGSIKEDLFCRKRLENEKGLIITTVRRSTIKNAVRKPSLAETLRVPEEECQPGKRIAVGCKKQNLGGCKKQNLGGSHVQQDQQMQRHKCFYSIAIYEYTSSNSETNIL